MKKEYKMSAARQQELQDELTYLKTVREKEVAELIKEARGFGDLSENSEYDEAKNEQGKLYSRIAELEDGSLLGFDARTVNTALARRLGNKLRAKHIRFAGDEDLIDALWPDRPPLSACKK